MADSSSRSPNFDSNTNNPSSRPRPRAKPKLKPRPKPKPRSKPTSVKQEINNQDDVPNPTDQPQVIIKADPDRQGLVVPDSAPSSSFVSQPRPLSSSEPIVATSMNLNMTMEETTSNNENIDEGTDDKILREINVYMSPSLSSTMTLLQYPLQPRRAAHHTHQSTFLTPEAARIRPIHNILELDYPIPASQTDADRFSSLPSSIANLRKRTLKSHAVKLHTHMAIGGWSADGNSIHLTPLSSPSSVMQMRPTFTHIDEAEGSLTAQSGTTTLEELQKNANKNKPQPIMLKNSPGSAGGGDPNAASQRQTYAEKIEQEQSEDWVSLNVYGPNTMEFREKKSKIESTFDTTIPIQFASHITNSTNASHAANVDGGRNYVKTLNYLPPTIGGALDIEALDIKLDKYEMDETNEDVTNNASNNEDILEKDAEALSKQERERTYLNMIKSFSSKIAAQMVKSGGCPLPYMLLRRRYIPVSTNSNDAVMSMEDVERLNAFAIGLSGSAVLIRGSCFVLKSSLMTWLHPTARIMRDVILILLNRDGMVEREKLLWKGKKAYDKNDMEIDESDKEKAEANIKAEYSLYLLNQVATKSKNCWTLKYNTVNGHFQGSEDNSFEKDFPLEASKYYEFWDKRKKTLRREIKQYDNAYK